MVLVKDSSSVSQLFGVYGPQFLEVHLVFEVQFLSPVWEIYVCVCSLSIVAVTAATIYLLN